MLIFTVIYGLMTNWLLYSLLYFLPFLIIFFLVELAYRRNRKYSLKISFVFLISFGILFLLIAPVGLDQVLNIISYYTTPTGSFGYYHPRPMEQWLNSIQRAYTWPETINMINGLTFFLASTTIGTLIIRNKTRLKYYLSLSLTATLILLFARLVNMGLILNWFVDFPILITFQHPGKIAMMVSWALFIMASILVNEVEERFVFPQKVTT